MLTSLLSKVSRQINVYSGISPSLLASISLGSSLKGNTHHELIDNLYKSNIAQCPTLKQALLQLDRASFTPHSHPYENKPYPIGKMG